MNKEPDSGLLFPEYGEAARYHDAGRFGFVAIASKDPWREKRFLVKELPQQLRYIDKTKDSYLSQAEFKRPGRSISNFLRISTSFVDLDTYNSPVLQGRSAEEMTEAVLIACEDRNLPRPNLVIFSGRGLYLKWIYDRPIPYFAIAKWNAVQRHIIERLVDLGADWKAADIARMLRLENTVNTKTGKYARVMYDDGGTWDFDELAREVLPFAPEKLRELKEEREARRLARQEKRLRNASPEEVRQAMERFSHFSIQSLAATRLWDIQNVIVPEQHGPEGVPEGLRDAFIFHGGVCISKFVSSIDAFDRELYQYSRNVVPSLTWQEARSYASSIRKRLEASIKDHGNRQYNVTNNKIIEQLQVMPETQRHCQTIISRDIKNERARKRKNEQRRADGVVEREEYESKRAGTLEANIQQAKELQDRGMPRKDIATAMNISIHTVNKYLYR